MYKFNEEKLLFEKTNVILKYRVIIGVLILFVFLASFSAVKTNLKKEELKEVIDLKDSVISAKNKKIEKIKTPLREETYVEDLYEAIGFKLTDKEYKRFSYLALKYRDDIEKAHVPASLIWWVAYKESRFNVNAKSTESSASGQFQFIHSSWKMSCKLAGVTTDGRFDEEKQVRIMLVYLNYLYNKYGNWEGVMNEYHGGVYHYPVNFLLK